MRITILTLFPDMFRGPFETSIVQRAIRDKKVDITYINIRDFATDSHKSVDDHPYGGGPGMILRVDILDAAISNAKCQMPNKRTKTVLLDPAGTTFTQAKARQYATLEHLVLICGHYEGIDERVRPLADESLSIGDYVLTGGELPAMVITDSVVRLIPGVLKKPEAILLESFSRQPSDIPYLEYPQYTRPEEYNGKRVPTVLLSGNHKKIREWQEAQSRTRSRKKQILP